MDLAERISTRLDTLSPMLQKAGRYVLEHPDEVATRSLRTVARQLGMSPPTFSRLATVLGLDGYDALREMCRTQLKRQEHNYASKARAMQDNTALENAGSAFIAQQARASIANINNLLASIDLGQIEKAAERLGSARKVILVGEMSSRPFVDYMAYVASMGFDNWNVLGSGPVSDANLMYDLGYDDTVLVLSKAPYAAKSIKAAQQLRRRGAYVIGITDGIGSPLCQFCNSSFFVSTETPQFFTSHTATLVLLETLVGLVVAKGGDPVRNRIAEIEAMRFTEEEYYPRPKTK
jgi:DNA-binding MurR/RpiR family transcriptional regulator